VIDIRYSDRPGVEIEAVEVHHPQDVAYVARHEQVGRTSRREADRGILVFGPFTGLRGTLLEEGLSRDTLRPTLENSGSARDAAQGPLGTANVVLGNLQLRPALFGKKQLVRVAEDNVAPTRRQCDRICQGALPVPRA
jgi:hypothetical protein